jgi:hypothetical protein
MRIYAPASLEAVQEVGGLDAIRYARVQDTIGLNSAFVDRLGTYPGKSSDVAQSDVEELLRRETEMVKEALTTEFDVELTPKSQFVLRLLGG